MSSDYPLTQDEFNQIYSKVPRLTVEVIVKTNAGVALTLRSIEPCIGTWHLPGGTVRYGESIEQAVRRIAKKELNIEVQSAVQVGIIEYPALVDIKYGDPRGIAFLIGKFSGEIEIDNEADEVKWFKSIPDNMFPNQGKFLSKHELIDSKQPVS